MLDRVREVWTDDEILRLAHLCAADSRQIPMPSPITNPSLPNSAVQSRRSSTPARWVFFSAHIGHRMCKRCKRRSN